MVHRAIQHVQQDPGIRGSDVRPIMSIDGEASNEPGACVGRLALERQHIKCQGRTPEATMASALYTDVKRKGNKSVFTRCVPSSLEIRGLDRVSFERELASRTEPSPT